MRTQFLAEGAQIELYTQIESSPKMLTGGGEIHGLRLRKNTCPKMKAKLTLHWHCARCQQMLLLPYLVETKDTTKQNRKKCVFNCVGRLIRIQFQHEHNTKLAWKTLFLFSIDGAGTECQRHYTTQIQLQLILSSRRTACLRSVGCRANQFHDNANANTLQLWKYRFMG